VESSCECGNELSSSIKCWETTGWMHNFWRLKWYSAPHSYLVLYIQTVEQKKLVLLMNESMYNNKCHMLYSTLTRTDSSIYLCMCTSAQILTSWQCPSTCHAVCGLTVNTVTI
jgi:hypothetical protein